MKFIYSKILVCLSLILSACATTLDPDIVPVSNFNADKYLGQWYEIARIENRFEKNLSQVTANYSYRDDGGIKVVNRGFNEKTGKWEEAVGKAYFVGDENTGHLKVSFFGPIYGPYVVFELDENYQNSFVTNHNKKYLWFLSRNKEVSPLIKEKFLSKVDQMGFDTDELIWVEQSSN